MHPFIQRTESPFGCLVHKSGPLRIGFDVSHQCQIIALLFDDETFETPLPHMPGRSVFFVVVTHMRRHHPLHESAQAPLFLWQQHQMKMVRHQAVGMHLHRLPLFRRFEQIEKVIVVRIVVEDLHPHVSPVDEMENATHRFTSGNSWHLLAFFLSIIQTKSLKVACPLLQVPFYSNLL